MTLRVVMRYVLCAATAYCCSLKWKLEADRRPIFFYHLGITNGVNQIKIKSVKLRQRPALHKKPAARLAAVPG